MTKASMAIVPLLIVCSSGQNKPEREFRFIVQHRLGASEQSVQKNLENQGAKIKARISSIRLTVITGPEGRAEAVRNGLQRSGLYNFVEADAVGSGQYSTNDPGLGSQWHHAYLQSASAWSVTPGSSQATIAVVDSGVEPSHPDLQSKLVPGWSFLTATSNTADVLGHGTAVAGAAAAAGDNGVGVAGVAWSSPVMPLVVLSSSNFAYYSHIADAIVYAADRGVRIINVSIAGTSASAALQSAIDYAWNKGAVVFAAAGNSGSSSPNYPAACDRAVAVSATDESDLLAGYSTRGSWIELSAPGNSIYTTGTGWGYGYRSGTSFASPVAAGVASLMLAANPNLSASSLVSLLQQNADDLGTPGFDDSYGWGRVNAYRAVLAARSAALTDGVAPGVSITSPAAWSTVSGSVTVNVQASDNVAVTRTELYVDGVLAATSPSGSISWMWNTATAANATHTLLAKAYDGAGNGSQTSNMVTVSNSVVADSQAPSVTITAPYSGARVGNNVKIQVSAYDNVAVSQVSVYVDGVLIGSSSVAPYSFTWNARKAAAGTHTITASAWDRAGNMGQSAAVIVSKDATTSR